MILYSLWRTRIGFRQASKFQSHAVMNEKPARRAQPLPGILVQYDSLRCRFQQPVKAQRCKCANGISASS
jgi:hypothetical protein